MNPSTKSSIAIFLFAIFLLPVTPSLAAEIEPEYQEAFDWLDKRGFPDLSKKRLVRTELQYWSQKPQYFVGFLLAENSESFRVKNLYLDEVDYKRSPSSIGTNSFKPIDLVEFAQQQLAPPAQMDPFARLGQRVSKGTELFCLARVCASREHADLANRLAAKAKQTLNQRRKEKLGLIDALAEDLSHSKTWKAFVRFGNTKVSRKELLTEFREIFRFYPQNKHRKRVQQTIVMLERMIREDEVHAKSPIQNPSRQQQIADLIFRLRDQNGQQ